MKTKEAKAIAEILDEYRSRLSNLSIKTTPTKSHNGGSTYSESLDHTLWMIRQVPDIYKSSETRGQRWIGYIQGTLRFLGVFTLEELKNHGRRMEAVAPKRRRRRKKPSGLDKTYDVLVESAKVYERHAQQARYNNDKIGENYNQGIAQGFRLAQIKLSRG